MTTLAGWLSQGTIAYTGAGSERVALLPLSTLPIAVAVAAGAAMFLAIRRGARAAPVMLPGLLLLPWLPLGLPAALLLWTGPLALLVWLAVAAAMARPVIQGVTPPERHQVLAGVLAFVIGAVAWWQVAPQVPGGDEPHYLVITQSLLKDGDLEIGNNHRRRDYASFAPGDLPPHVQVLRRDGRIYSIHAPGLPAVVAPAFAIGGYGGAVLLLLAIAALGSALTWHLAWLATRRTDAAWFGWAAVTLSVTWIFHSFTIYPDGPGAVLLLTGVWALLRADEEKRNLTGQRIPRSTDPSIHRSTDPPIHRSTDLPIHRSTDPPIYRSTDPPIHRSTDLPIHRSTDPPIHRSTDPPIHQSTDPPIHRSADDSVRPWLWHGAALAALPWMHSRFSVLAGGVAALVLLRLAHVPHPASKALAFLSVPIVSALGWFGYFIALYGTPDPSAPYAPEPASFAFVPDGLAGLLFDQRFGLVAYAPVLMFAVIGIGVMLARSAWRREALELLFVVVPYLVVVTHFAMWWGGRSAPARFFLPVLLWMAIPAAVAWASMTRRATRLTAIGALLVTAFASGVLVFVQDGALAFNSRETYAQWLEWLNGTVNLARALPVWWRDTEIALFRGIAVWLAAGVAAWLVLRALERQGRLPLATAAVLVYAAAASAAAAIIWTAEGVPGRLTTPSQLDALRRLSADRQLLALTLSPPGRIDRGDLAARLRLIPDFSTVPGGAGRNDRPLFAVPALPAGEYRLRPIADRTDGWLMIGIGRDQFAIRTVPLEEARASLLIRFPVDVRALLVRGDEEARRHVTGLQIDPVRLVMPEDRLARGVARQAARYDTSTVWFMDDGGFPEREAFWIGGARSSEVVIQPDRPHPAEVLLVRNGAAENTVLIETKGWREAMRLGAGEERRVQVPSDVARGATWLRITTSAGFTPSAVDPNSRDHRFLGVWVKVGG